MNTPRGRPGAIHDLKAIFNVHGSRFHASAVGRVNSSRKAIFVRPSILVDGISQPFITCDAIGTAQLTFAFISKDLQLASELHFRISIRYLPSAGANH